MDNMFAGRTTPTQFQRLGSQPLICHLNVRSISSKLEELSDLISDNKINIMAVTETWLSNEQFLQPPSLYSVLRQDYTDHCGGIAIFVKQGPAYSRCPELCLKTQTLEVLTIEVMLKKKILLSVVYRHPKSPASDMEKLENLFSAFMISHKLLYILGDFNIDISKQTPKSCTKSFCDLLSRLGLYQLIQHPTRVTRLSSTTIDLIITNAKNTVEHSGVLPYGISDHNIVYCTLKTKLPKPEKIKIQIRNVKNLDPLEYIKDLQTKDWQPCLETRNVDKAVGTFNKLMTSVIDKHCPKKIITISQKNTAPWFTKEHKVIIKRREIARARANKTNLSVHWDIYRDLRNLVNKLIKKAKISHYHTEMSTASSSKAKWKVVNKLLGRSVRSTLADMPDGDHLNEYFANICTAERQEIDMTNTEEAANTSHSPLVLLPVSKEDIISTIFHLPKKSSEGVDGINTELLQKSLVVTLPVVQHIINLSIETSTFPTIWKSAIITPIFKGKGLPENPGNYRPVALLSVLSRVTEKLVLKQMFSHIDKHKILTNCQHAFRPKHSTQTALLEVTDYIWMAMDKQMLTTNILLDLSKAFDKVDHTILLRKLGSVGIVDNWFKSYLTARQQCVKTTDCISSYRQTTCGVPQGSCLGPVLFSLYTNDLPSRLRTKVVMYADDTQLLASYKPCQQDAAANLLQRDLTTIQHWMTVNKLKINGTKTQLITFGTRQQLNKTNTDIAGKLLLQGEMPTTLTTTKNLGVEFNNTMSWDTHIAQLSKKVNAALIQLAKVKQYVPVATLRATVQTLALSNLHYCPVVWSTASQKNMSKLEKSVRLAGRICNFTFDSVSDIVDRKVKGLARKANRKGSSEYINNCLVTNVRGNNIKPRCKTSSGQKALPFRLALL